MIAEEANISPSRGLTSPRYRRVLPDPAAPATNQIHAANKTALERQKSKKFHTVIEIS
jgi:hypothetical protein